MADLYLTFSPATGITEFFSSFSFTSFVDNKMSVLIIFLALAFIFFTIIIYYIYSTGRLRNDNMFRFMLNLENMWNSSVLAEARQKGPVLITRELLDSKNNEDKQLVHYARMIIDFFNHIGLQVWQGIIDFEPVYNLLGDEILIYGDNKNYRLLADKEHESYYPANIHPWPGFDLLYNITKHKKGYVIKQYSCPVKLPESLLSCRSNSLNGFLFVLIFLALISLGIFFFSYLRYNSYL